MDSRFHEKGRSLRNALYFFRQQIIEVHRQMHLTSATTLLLELEQRLQRLVLELQQQELRLLVQHLQRQEQELRQLGFPPLEQRFQQQELHRENDRPSRHENEELLLRQQHPNRRQRRRHQFQLCFHWRCNPK